MDSHGQRQILNTARANIKTAVRRIVRARGYELVPQRAGFERVQREILQHCQLVYDVGANVGQFAERLFDFGFGGAVVSFEPGSAAFALLQAKAKRVPNWEARNLALGSDAGSATLNLSANSVSSSLLAVGERHVAAAPSSRVTGAEDVLVSTLAAHAPPAGSTTYLKLDVQGFELPVLQGAEETLAGYAYIQLEASLQPLYDGENGWLEVCRFLEARGFFPIYIEPGYEDRATLEMLQVDILFRNAIAKDT